MQDRNCYVASVTVTGVKGRDRKAKVHHLRDSQKPFQTQDEALADGFARFAADKGEFKAIEKVRLSIYPAKKDEGSPWITIGITEGVHMPIPLT